jgi:hypothetical protein
MMIMKIRTTMMMMIGVFFQTVKHILRATFACFQYLLFTAAAAKIRVSQSGCFKRNQYLMAFAHHYFYSSDVKRQFTQFREK